MHTPIGKVSFFLFFFCLFCAVFSFCWHFGDVSSTLEEVGEQIPARDPGSCQRTLPEQARECLTTGLGWDPRAHRAVTRYQAHPLQGCVSFWQAMGRWWGDLGVHYRREIWVWNTHRASLRRCLWRWRCGSRLTRWRRTVFLPPNPGRCPHAAAAHAGWAQCDVGPGWSTRSGSTAPAPSSRWLGLGAPALCAARRPDTHPGTSGCACPRALPSSGAQQRSAHSSAHTSAQRTAGGPPPRGRALLCRRTRSCHPGRLPGCGARRPDQGLCSLCRGAELVPKKGGSGPCLRLPDR